MRYCNRCVGVPCHCSLVYCYIVNTTFTYLGRCSNTQLVQFTIITPVCSFSILAKCPELLAPANGRVTWTGLTAGHTSTYTCDSGSQLVGQVTRTCSKNGEWSGNPPACKSKYALFLCVLFAGGCSPFSAADLVVSNYFLLSIYIRVDNG